MGKGPLLLANRSGAYAPLHTQTIRNYMQRNPAIAAVVAEARELFVDVAALKLYAAVQRGEAWAICFTRKCLAKDRGYVERWERTGANGQSLPPGWDKDIVVISGAKAEYLAKLRALRGAPQIAAPRATPVPLFGSEPRAGERCSFLERS